MTTQAIDQAKAEAFAGKMLDTLNGSALGLFCSVGHRTGLFDVLAKLPPSTSAEVAKAGGLNERYVREWLGGMTVTGVVEYDASTRKYGLPPEHAAFLTRDAGPNNFAFFMQYIGLVADVEAKIVDCFRRGGGVPYSDFPNFQMIQAEETGRVYDAVLVSDILPLAPGIPERLNQGIDVLDIGCGGGHAINVMARAFPNSRFTGMDLSEEGVGMGKAEANAWGLTNATFEVQDVSKLPEGRQFDLVTAFDTIHDQAWPRQALAAAARAMKAGGTFLMGDIAASSNVEENLDHPMGGTLYMFSLFHCMTVSLAQGGEGLGACWGEQMARELLAEAGFTKVSTGQVEGDVLNIYYACQK